MGDKYDIQIVGEIGSYIDEKGQKIKGVDLIDVMSSFPSDKKEVVIGIHSPGGSLQVAKDIRAFIDAKKAEGVKITTTTIPDLNGMGLVGSAATEIYGAGDVREIDLLNDLFCIHLPLFENLPNANSIKLGKALEIIAPQEQELLKSYVSLTGQPEKALKSLMIKAEPFNGQKAIDLGFATTAKKTVQTQRLVNKIQNMDFKKMLDDFKNEIKNMLPAPAPTVKALELKLADGSIVTSDATDASALVGSSTNAPDGTHTLADGTSIVVAGGKITEVKPVEQASLQNQYVTVAQFQEFAAMVKDSLSSVAKPMNELKASVDSELVNIKNQIKGKHTPPTKQYQTPSESDISVKNLVALRTEGKIEEYKNEYKRKYGVEPEL
ncbi:MAG: ATP-dependent Clp protease proteolytic subunit [Flammeovirgaceae bacterium]